MRSKQFPVQMSRAAGMVKRDEYRFEVVRRAGMEERVVERNAIEISLRVWRRGQVVEGATQAGLECEGV